MNLEDIPLFSMMKSRMGYISQRERLISENVANADTPGFVPKDLKAFTLSGIGAGAGAGAGAGTGTGGGGGQLGMVQLAKTNAAHLGPALTGSAASAWKPVSAVDSEVKLDGNAVSLEEQMSKMTESRVDYEAVIGFYQKSLEMLRIAATPPGK